MSNSKEKLIDCLNDNWAWRKKELINLKVLIACSKGNNKDTLLRCATALLYAHWEGYIKESAKTFWEYIAHEKKTLQELDYNTASIFLERQYKSYVKLPRTDRDEKPFGYLMKYIIENLKEPIHLPIDKDVIQTKSNLNYDRFCDILIILGFDPKPFEIFKNHINLHLVLPRNQISHGDSRPIEEKYFAGIMKKTFNIIYDFDSRIIDYIN